MGIFETIGARDLTPSRLWRALDEPTRTRAALALYAGTWQDASARGEADEAVVEALRFRPQAVRKLPLEKRAGYLARFVRPDDSLASSLLMALHFEHRQPMLEAFLDRLGIPQQGGIIDEKFELRPPAAPDLDAAVREIGERFPREEVELYLASLLALDADQWAGLLEPVRALSSRGRS